MKRNLAFILAALAVFCLCACDSPAAEPSPTGGIVHNFPEKLLDYECAEQGVESIDLSQTHTLVVYANHCEYGEPQQDITDPEVIRKTAEAITAITVTDGPDGISSTGTYYVFKFMDSDGKYIAGFSFQDGMLMETHGRLPVTGYEALLDIEGYTLNVD